jgi:hypothetical protein
MTCKATRMNDQMMCGACGLQWDVVDLDRPDCITVQVREIKKIKSMFDGVPDPVDNNARHRPL